MSSKEKKLSVEHGKIGCACCSSSQARRIQGMSIFGQISRKFEICYLKLFNSQTQQQFLGYNVRIELYYFDSITPNLSRENKDSEKILDSTLNP